jgi:hypothetical protein
MLLKDPSNVLGWSANACAGVQAPLGDVLSQPIPGDPNSSWRRRRTKAEKAAPARDKSVA